MEFMHEHYKNDLFNENLNFLIKNSHITKVEIEKKIGIGEGSLSRYCKKNNPPKPGIDILISIAKGFGITLDELINENIKEKRKIQNDNNKRKDIMFCNKLIKETNENIIPWTKYSINEGSEICEDLLINNPYDSDIFFRFQELNKEYNISEIDIICAKIKHSGLEIFILRLPPESDEICFAYQLYLRGENGKMITGGSSYLSSFLDIEIDKKLHDKLENLYDSANYYINFGKERFEREKIFDKYLNIELEDINESEMPF